jgi:hypothetical protein
MCARRPAERQRTFLQLAASSERECSKREATVGLYSGLAPRTGVGCDAKLFFPEEYPERIAEEARRLWGIMDA